MGLAPRRQELRHVCKFVSGTLGDLYSTPEFGSAKGRSIRTNVRNKEVRQPENTFEEQKKALFIEKEQWANEKEQILKEVERLEVETSTNKTTIKDLKTLLGQEKGFREKVARLQAQLESSEERRKEALSRGNRLEKELASIARKKRARA